MSIFLDNFQIKPNILSEEFNLYKPVLNQSVAGVIPSLINNFNFENPPDLKQFDWVQNPDVEKRIQEQFPSGFDNIIMFICDGLSIDRLQTVGGALWENITNKGTIASTMFPTMTSTVMTSLSYGKYPSDHGLVGYNTYNEHIDSIWNSLNLKYVKDGEPTYVTDQYSLDKFVTGMPILDTLNAQEETIPITFLAPDQFEGPGLIDIIKRSGDITLYKDPIDAGMKLMHALNQDVKNQMIAVYIPYADMSGHFYGPESTEYTQALLGINQSLEMLLNHPKIKDKSTIVALTSDHGQSQIDHSISQWMTRDQVAQHQQKGVTLASSGRTIHAYCDPNNKDKAYATLEEMADGKGMIIDKSQSIEFAGGSQTFEKRFAEYSLLTQDGYLHDVPEVVLLYDETKLRGQHGSLTEKELFVPVGIFGGVD